MRLLLPFLLLLAPACSGGGTIDFRDIDIAGVSNRDTTIDVYFSVEGDRPCAGVKVDEVGDRRILTFLAAGADGLELAAIEATEEPWTGNLVVRVPKPADLLARGGKLTLEYAGSGEPGMEWDVRPPATD